MSLPDIRLLDNSIVMDGPVAATGEVVAERFVGLLPREQTLAAAGFGGAVTSTAPRERVDLLARVRAAEQQLVTAFAQHGWRWCRACTTLYLWGDHARSVCPRNGTAGHDPAGSGAYVVTHTMRREGAQANWACCFKCRALFHAGEPSRACPAGDVHQSAGSLPYQVFVAGTATELAMQAGWKFCRACLCLVFPSGDSRCAGNGGAAHVPGDGVYAVQHT